MYKKGFTLIELIATIIILGLIGLIVYPTVNNVINDSKEKVYKHQIEELVRQADVWVANNQEKIGSRSYILTFDQLYRDGIINQETIINSKTGEKLAGCMIVKWNNQNRNYNIRYSEDCQVKEYSDASGANVPELLDNMVPVKYVDDNWVVADVEEKWYDYNNKEWANAVVLYSNNKNVGDIVLEKDIKEWYVWIPRYKYVIFNGSMTSISPTTINISFEKNVEETGTVNCTVITSPTSSVSEVCTDSTQTDSKLVNGQSTYTHPAFCKQKEADGSCKDVNKLTGFWIGKFELSISNSKCWDVMSDGYGCNKVNDARDLVIKPNTRGWNTVNISNLYYSIKNMGTTNNYTHMTKSMEWGAVAYLSHSKYGINQEIYINNSHITGRSGGNVGGTVNHSNYGLYTYDGKTISSDGVIGSFASDRTLGTKASTTGNIYGAYDMSGGLWEFVMANAIGTDGFSVNLSGFTTPPDSMDYDIYINSTSNSGNYKTSKLGDALGETKGWYNDTVSFPSPTAAPFIIRGGISSYGKLTGIFADLYAEGFPAAAAISTRVTISKK